MLDKNALINRSYLAKILRAVWGASLTWKELTASARLPLGSAYCYHHFHNGSHHERTKSSFLPCLTLTIPFLSTFARRNDDDDSSNNDICEKRRLSIFLTATGASKVSPERLAAIKALNVVSKVVEEVSPAVVSITAMGHLFQGHASSGSGFIVSDAGLVITNAHVVGYKQALKVTTSDGRNFNAKVLAIDINSDLALVQILADASVLKKLPVLELASGEQPIRPGDFVIALGSPLSLSNTVTTGVISAVDRDLGNRCGLKYIQTDAIISFGNSGGPLVSLYGEAIGVNTMIAETGLGFAIPIDQVNRFLDTAKAALAAERDQGRRRNTRHGSEPPSRRGQPEPRQAGSPWHWFRDGDEMAAGQDNVAIVVDSDERQKRYLGLMMRTLTPDLAFDLVRRGHLHPGCKTGVYICGVIRDSPAERADLRPGDVIISINDVKITNANEVAKVIQEQESFYLTVIRGGEQVKINNIRSEPV